MTGTSARNRPGAHLWDKSTVRRALPPAVDSLARPSRRSATANAGANATPRRRCVGPRTSRHVTSRHVTSLADGWSRAWPEPSCRRRSPIPALVVPGTRAPVGARGRTDDWELGPSARSTCHEPLGMQPSRTRPGALRSTSMGPPWKKLAFLLGKMVAMWVR